MNTYITIDGGTTNTRLNLVRNETVLATVKLPFGARANMDGTAHYREAIRDAIRSLCKENGQNEKDISRILASGMITSEFGLCCLPHVTAPAGIGELHDSMHETVLSDISEIPFVFVRGVKTVGSELSEIDMMRGEECELFGILEKESRECLYVLPGSHSKLIECDAENRIVKFSTMLTGEMIASLSSGTILRDAVDLSVSEFDEEKLLMGYRYAMKHGFSEAIFKTRVLKNHMGASREAVYSFFIGVVLSPEIESIIRSKPTHVVIGGKAQIKTATAMLLRAFSDKTVTVLSGEDVDASSARGVVRVYEWRR